MDNIENERKGGIEEDMEEVATTEVVITMEAVIIMEAVVEVAMGRVGYIFLFHFSARNYLS